MLIFKVEEKKEGGITGWKEEKKEGERKGSREGEKERWNMKITNGNEEKRVYSWSSFWSTFAPFFVFLLLDLSLRNQIKSLQNFSVCIIWSFSLVFIESTAVVRSPLLEERPSRRAQGSAQQSWDSQTIALCRFTLIRFNNFHPKLPRSLLIPSCHLFSAPGAEILHWISLLAVGILPYPERE